MGLDKMRKDFRFAKGIFLRKPFSVLIQLTNRCNMRCSFCDFWANGVRPEKELKVADYEKLSEELAELGCFLISVEGGEPFVRPDLIEIMAVLGRHHLPVLYTNGWYVTQESAKELFDVGMHQVGVSIDFATPEKHDQKRGIKGAFDRAWQAIDWFKEAAPYGGKQVHVMSVLMEENRQDIEPLVKMSAEKGVYHTMTLLSLDGFRRKKGEDEALRERFGQELLALWKKYPHIMMFKDYFSNVDAFLDGRKADLPTCRAGKQTFNVDHLGGVAPCIEKIDQPVGNIREEPLKDILQKLQATQDEVSQCQECWTLCRAFGQMLGGGGSMQSWWDMSTRMRL